jgi:hypothetical protein
MNTNWVFVLAALLAMSSLAEETPANSSCPVTIGTNSLGAPFPEAENWYGSEVLAVVLAEDGRWPITSTGSRIAVKLFIWSVGYKPWMEESLSIQIESLSGGTNDTTVKDITNAHSPSLGGWTMLAGIDFPSVGCWRLTLDYLGQSLAFVVETYDPAINGPAT